VEALWTGVVLRGFAGRGSLRVIARGAARVGGGSSLVGGATVFLTEESEPLRRRGA
jgi:hypothetical protein